MLVQLIEGTLLVVLTVAIHGVTMSLAVWRLRRVKASSFWRNLLIVARLAVWCVLAHMAEILLWALFYVWHGVMPDMETAGYFSAVTYATIGYGDVTPPADWRLLASMEGLTGILMCAWSGGFTFAIISHLIDAGDADQETR